MESGRNSRSGRSGQVNLWDRPRYMHREWNPRKVKTLRALSVPNLKLLPANRPLFHCRRCHFSNDRYHICLFCGWTSQDAEDDFQCKIQRRTLSSPYRLELFSLHRRVQVHIPSQSVARSPESLQSIPNPIPTLAADGVALSCEEASPSLCHDYIPRTQTAPDNDNDTSGNTTIPAILPTPSHKGHARALDCQSSGCCLDAELEAVVTATLVPIPISVPTSTSSSGSSPVLALAATRAAVCQDDYDSSYDVDSTPSKETSIPRPEEQVSRFSNVHFSDSVDRSSTPASSSTSVDMTFTTTSTMNPHSATAVRVLADVSNGNHSIHSEIAAVPSHTDSNPCASSSNLTAASSALRALRHKKRQAVLHFSAPTPPSGEASAGPSIGNKSSSSTMNTVRTTNTVRPQSHPHTQLSSASASTVMSSGSSTSIPITRISVHSRSQSQPNVNLVLGNKERPYYSAIRKDMAIASASAVMPASLPTSTSGSSTYDVFSPSSRSSSTPLSTLVQLTSTSAAASRSAFSFSSSFSPTSSSSAGSRAHSPTSHPNSHPIFTPNPGSSRIPIPSFPTSPLPSSSPSSPYLSPSSSSSTPWSCSSLQPGSFGRPSTASRPSTSSRLSFATTSNTTSNTRPSLDSTRSVSPTPAWLFDSNITNINLKDIDNADDAELPTPVFSPPSHSPFPFYPHSHPYQHHGMSLPVTATATTFASASASRPSSPLARIKSHVHIPSAFRRHTTQFSSSQSQPLSSPVRTSASSSGSSYALGNPMGDDYLAGSDADVGASAQVHHNRKLNSAPSFANLTSNLKLHLRSRHRDNGHGQDHERRYTAPSASLSSPPPHARISKISKKEEMQLRMALAREVGHGGLVPDEGYVYREEEKRSRGSWKMKGKIRLNDDNAEVEGNQSRASVNGVLNERRTGIEEDVVEEKENDMLPEKKKDKSRSGVRKSKRGMMDEVKAFVMRRLS